MTLINHLKQKKKTIGVIAGIFAVALLCFGVLPNVFATSNISVSTSGEVALDGTNDGSVSVVISSSVADTIHGVQATFQPSVSDSSGTHLTLTELTPGGAVTPTSNETSDGIVYWLDGTLTHGFDVSAGGAIWTGVYAVDKDTPAGDYTISIPAEIITAGADYDAAYSGTLTATVTVTRNDTPATKPSQVVTFRDGSGNPVTGLTQWYGDADITITKEVTTGDGAITEYHPDDDGSGTVAHTAGDMVGFGEPGNVDICAWVAETENYAATKACFSVEVTKRPIGVDSATIANKTYDGTTSAEVTAVTFSNLGGGTPPTYTAEGTFGTADAGADKAIRVDVTLTGEETLAHYTLSPSYINTTKTISPYVLNVSGVSFSDGTDTYIYDPDGVEPGVTVEANVHGGTSTLVLDADYEVEYTDNTGVGTGHAKITGKGNFTTGALPIDLSFTITKATIANEDVTAPSSIVDGHILSENEVSVSVNGHTLTQCAADGAANCDYLLTITNNTGVVGDTVAVRVEGRNNYDGTVNKNVNIVDKLPQTVTFGEITNTTVDKSYGDEDFTNVATIVETGEGHGEISYRSTNESVVRVNESGTVSIVGVGDADIYATAAETATYAEGSAKYTVHVDKKAITITGATVATKTYDGATPATVSSASLSVESLVFNTDFTAVGAFLDVNVGNNKAVLVNIALSSDTFAHYCFIKDDECRDMAAIITNGVIEAFNLNGDTATADLTANSFVYNGSEKTPGATVKADLDGDGIKETTLASETDYDMNYENNVNRGTGSATVSGKGNYAGSLAGLEFEIIAAPVENVVVTAPSQDYTGEALEPVPTVTGEINGSSMTFSAGDYYVIPHADFKNAGSYTFSVKSVDGGNYYFDSTDGSFTINKVASGNPAEMTAGLKIAAGCTLAELGERTVGFAWTNPDTVVGAGNQTFPATYLQNDDSTNYTPITVDVPVYGLKRLSVVTAIMGEGGEVTNPGDLAVEEDELTWTISPDEGYELESFVINAEDKTSEVSGGRFTMIAGTDNVTAIVRFRKVYEVINGAGQTHIRGVDGAAEFEIDAEYELFEDDGKVYVDDELVDPENYDSRSGSTIITFSADYLNSLTVGEHTLAVVFADNGIARTTFIIADPEAEDDNPAAADTGVFTSATGGAIATGASVMVMGALVSAMFLAKKNRKE